MSLEIVHEELSGEARLLPRFALRGALPDALLELYDFWRGNDRLVGRLQARRRNEGLHATCLVVHLTGAVPGTKAHVQRLTLEATRKDEEKQLDELMFARSSNMVQGETLVDLLRAKPKSQTWQVAQWLLQLEDLSHILAWSSAQVLRGELQDAKPPALQLVELPRLGLTFRAPDERTSKSAAERPRGVPALRCDQYGGLKVLGERSVHNQKGLQRLIKPFPRFVLLEDEVGDLFLLASLAERPRRSTQGLEWIRGDSSWLSKLRLEQRHQLYRIFVNEILVAPNVLAELHLMLLRVAQGMFGDACSSVAACTASTLPQPPEESLLWEEMTSMLQGDTSMGATVLRLKLILQLHRQGQGVPDGWNPEADFLAWANYGQTSSVTPRHSGVWIS
ncbi:unnamed protein product [Durusdinium trenchii]|uniref:Uncharacterized protein n=1 Tax=Durusdinium trenchii TaxID=1381693 RepID=A0ABP0JN42_9DINO